MKTGLVMCGPDVAYGPLALLSGTFEEKARRAADLGFDGVELMVRDPAGLDWQHVKNTLGAAGLQVPQVVTGELFGADGLSLATQDESLYQRTCARLESVIDLAAFLGAMVNIGRVRGQLKFLDDAAHAWDIAVERLRRIVLYAADKGVRITLEPLNRYETDFIYNTEEGMRLVTDIGCENFGLMLDLFHMNIEDASIEQGLQQAGAHLWHIHIADSNRRSPGAGHIRFEPIFAMLNKMGYDRYISAEMFPLPDPDTAARETKRFLDAHLNH